MAKKKTELELGVSDLLLTLDVLQGKFQEKKEAVTTKLVWVQPIDEDSVLKYVRRANQQLADVKKLAT